MNAKVWILLPGLLLAGCVSTPADRIARNRAAFDSWPAPVQALVQAGHIAVGFTADQVRLALGAPDRITLRTTAAGTDEIWTYHRRRPRFSLGVGVVGGGGGTRVGGATEVSSGGPYGGGYLRVILAAGRVSAVEQEAR
ncbi:MAG TPA: hypothetical protein VMD31_02775 [Opitutaceae bacterium]|nr:hypothetical protein [Opitutaceae bacterium]